MDPRFGSIGIWIGVCKVPTCYPLVKRVPPQPCFDGPGASSSVCCVNAMCHAVDTVMNVCVDVNDWSWSGTDSLATLREDCEWTKQMVVRCLQLNSTMLTNAVRKLKEMEEGKDDSYWFSMRVRARMDRACLEVSVMQPFLLLLGCSCTSLPHSLRCKKSVASSWV